MITIAASRQSVGAEFYVLFQGVVALVPGGVFVEAIATCVAPRWIDDSLFTIH